jgi:hypothetical protein
MHLCIRFDDLAITGDHDRCIFREWIGLLAEGSQNRDMVLPCERTERSDNTSVDILRIGPGTGIPAGSKLFLKTANVSTGGCSIADIMDNFVQGLYRSSQIPAICA